MQMRGIAVSAELEERIRTCRDREQLDRWTRLAATATAASDLEGA
jgi:hypothetical protein